MTCKKWGHTTKKKKIRSLKGTWWYL